MGRRVTVTISIYISPIDEYKSAKISLMLTNFTAEYGSIYRGYLPLSTCHHFVMIPLYADNNDTVNQRKGYEYFKFNESC
jgi:hypothetical protein